MASPPTHPGSELIAGPNPVSAAGHDATSAAALPSPPSTLVTYLAACGAVAVATALGWLAARYGLEQSVVLFYLVAVVVVGSRLALRAALVTAVTAAVAYAYVFVPPAFGWPTTRADLLALAAFLLVAVVVGSLTARLRALADVANRRARHAEALRAATRALAAQDQLEGLLATAATHGSLAVAGRTLVLSRGADEGSFVAHGEAGLVEAPAGTIEPARAALQTSHLVRWTGTDPPAEYAAFPLLDRAGNMRALVARRSPQEPWTPEALELLEGLGLLTADAIERVRLAEQARRAEVESRTERLRNSLLSSVSHDLRTPLAVILGATSHLAESGPRLSEEERTALAREAEREADRLNRLVSNLLAMTRLDAGAIRPKKEWQPIEDVIGSAVGRMEKQAVGRRLEVVLEPDLPLVPIDAVLVEQVLVNLLDNACRHTPPGTEVTVRARRAGEDEIAVEVLDRGQGIPAGREESIFERLNQGSASSGQHIGLGLAICRGIVTVHGGTLRVGHRPGGGSVFRFQLPLGGTPPAVPAREADVTGATP